MTAPTVSDLFARSETTLCIVLCLDDNGEWLSYLSPHQPVEDAQVIQEGDGPHAALENLLRAPATAEVGA